MTTDEISQLEAGPEIDALVATEVMGWKWQNEYWDTTPWVSGKAPHHVRRTKDWQPSKKASQALLVWQAMEYWGRILVVEPCGEGGWTISECDKVIGIYDVPFPLAICQAALTTMQEEKDTDDAA